jgi:hypothetical protein
MSFQIRGSYLPRSSVSKVSAEWPLSRSVEIWNSAAGNIKVKKFQNHRKACHQYCTSKSLSCVAGMGHWDGRHARFTIDLRE